MPTGRAPETVDAPDDDLADILRRLHDDETAAPVAAPVVGAALTRPTDVERPERASVATIESDGGLAFDPQFASFAARAIGLAVDVVVLAVLELPAIALIALGSDGLVLAGIAVAIVAFVLSTSLYARSVARTGRSPGNRVANTTVVDVRNGRHVTVAVAATRYVLRMIVSPILFFGFLMALGNSSRRTFHDQFAGTVVTRPPRASWSIDDDPAAARP